MELELELGLLVEEERELPGKVLLVVELGPHEAVPEPVLQGS
jgi:hypothetical protein